MNDTPSPPQIVGVLDMGASAIRLAIAEVTPGKPPRVIEEAAKGVLLGRDTFSFEAIRSHTLDAAIGALEGFRKVMDGYGVSQVWAVATSAVREARNGDTFLDRIRGRTGITFEIINEAEESRLVYLAVRDSLGAHPSFLGARSLLVEVGGGSTSLTLLRRGAPNRSGVYALGSVRLRQQLDLRRHSHDVQLALLRRYIANIIEEVRLEIPLKRISHIVAIGGDVRFVAAQLLDEQKDGRSRRLPAIASWRSAKRSSGSTKTAWSSGSVCRRSKPRRWCRHCSCTARWWQRRRRGRFWCPTRRCGRGCSSTSPIPAAGSASRTSSGRCWRARRRSGSGTDSIAPHGHHVAKLANRLFDDLKEEHGLGDRERLLLQVAALLHDVGVYVSLRAHHKHSQYLSGGLADFRLVRRGNRGRLEHRPLPSTRLATALRTCPTSRSIGRIA